MNEAETIYTARRLIAVHGLRAQAVAQEHLAEALQQGDTAAAEHWENVEAAIAELRRSAAKHTAPA